MKLTLIVNTSFSISRNEKKCNIKNRNQIKRPANSSFSNLESMNKCYVSTKQNIAKIRVFPIERIGVEMQENKSKK